jgi:hypothetical protein
MVLIDLRGSSEDRYEDDQPNEADAQKDRSKSAPFLSYLSLFFLSSPLGFLSLSSYQSLSLGFSDPYFA